MSAEPKRRAVIKPAPSWLSEEAAELMARRMDRLEELIECDRPFTLEDWGRFCLVLLPELYGEPPKDRLTTAAAPGSPGKSRIIYQRSLQQLSLWHHSDPDDFPADLRDVLRVLMADDETRKKWRRLRAARREPKERKEPPPRKKGRHYHQGMFRFEDVPYDWPNGTVPRDYDACEHRRKGDETADGEANARVRRYCGGPGER